MLEPLAATVLNSVLPSRPLATQLFASRSTFGMAVRHATHAFPHDFFTPHPSGVKGKGRALPDDEHGVYSSTPDGLTPTRYGAISASEEAVSTSAFPPRSRTRRTSGHKCIASGSSTHIPSLRSWTRQVHVAQRRHVSSRTAAVEALQHSSPRPDERHAWVRTFKAVAQGTSSVSPEDAWRAFECLWRVEPPGPPSLTLSFLANVSVSAVQGEPSTELLHRWGQRLQEALHHIDPGIRDVPGNYHRVRWNALFLSADAMLGRVDEAVEAAAMLYHQSTPTQSDARRARIVEAYLILLVSLRQHRGARAVVDLLVDHPWLRPYFTASAQPPELVPIVTQFYRVVLPLVSELADPIKYLRDLRKVLSPSDLSKLGVLLIRAALWMKRDAYPIVQAMQRDSIYIPRQIFHKVARDLARAGKLDIAGELLASASASIPMAQRGTRPRPSYHSTALFLCSREGDVDAAEEHYRALIRINAVHHDDQAAYMHAYAVAGRPERVVELFRELFPWPSDRRSTTSPESRDTGPNIVHYTTVIYAFAQAGDLDGVNVWLGKLSQAGLRPDLHVYSIILQSFASRGDIESMISLLDQMRGSGIAPTPVIYTTLIATLARRQDPMAAERLYKRAIDEGVVPDRTMITTIMNAHVEAGSWQGVIRAFDYMNTPGRPGANVTIEVFNTLLKAYVLIGAPFRTVVNVFQQVTANLRPDARSFALLIQSACDSGLMNIAEELFGEMERLATEEKQTALRANIYVLTIMLRGYLLSGQRIKAREIMTRIQGLGLKPTAITYSAILRAYGMQKTDKGLQVAEQYLQSLISGSGENTWEELERSRQLAVEIVYRPLLHAYLAKEKYFDVERVHKDMIEAGGQPTLGSLTTLLDVHRRTGNIEEVRALWPEIHRLGLEYARLNTLLSLEDASTPSLRGHGIVMCIPLSIYVDALSAAGDHAEVARVWKTLKDQGLQFDSHNWNHLVTALVRAGEPQRAFDVVENIIIRHQDASRRRFDRGRDTHPKSPVMLDLPPPEEGDLPPPPPEAPLHNPRRRAEAVERSTRRQRQIANPDANISDDFAHPLHMLQQLSPLWSTWRPHGATLTLLGRVLDHLQSGRLVQAVRPGSDEEFEHAALDAKEIRRRTERAGKVLGEIYDAYPRTVQLVREYELMRRSSRRSTSDDG